MDEDFKDVKNGNKYLRFIPIIVAILLIAVGAFFLLNNNKKEEETVVSLKDDFYESINNGNSKKTFQDGQNKIYENQKEIGTKIEEDVNYTNDNYFAFFDTFEDTETRNQNGIKELQPYFDEIDNAQNLDQFSDIVLKVNYDLGVNTFLNWELGPDIYDNSRNVIILNPMTLESLGTFTLNPHASSSLEFFTSDKYKVYKDAFEEARIEYLKLYGYDEEKAKKTSDDISEFAKVIQDKSVSLDELAGNVSKYYKNYSYNELKSIIKNLPIDKFLNKYGISNFKNFALFDEGHLKALDSYYTEEHLPLMKEILKVAILEEIASLNTSKEYAEILANSSGKLTGEGNINSDALLIVYEYLMLKPKMMGSYLNVKYDEEYFTEIEKQEIIELINKIKEHYKEVINSSSWLDESTKAEALKKLDTMKTNVGYVQKEEEPTTVKLVNKENGGTLLSNVILLAKDNSSKLANKINKETTIELDQYLANAYYNPLNNSINFPSGFREVYRSIKDKYEIYGYAGMVVAHEISHAFDNNGSQYDEKGNIRNWWSEKDKENFDKLTQKIIDYYSNYEVFGLKVDGKKTVGENIADLAAIKTIISIMEKENATNDDYKKFFESYAKLWNEKITKQQLELTMLSDNHSPNKIRVNAVLSSTDKFYEVYGITENDKMYVAPENRVGLW